MQTESWGGTIEREWHQLRRADLSLDVEKFFRHVVAANKTGFLSPESLAAIANALLTSALGGAPYLGRRLLERIGANRHPALRVVVQNKTVTLSKIRLSIDLMATIPSDKNIIKSME